MSSWAAALGRGRRDSMQGKTIADRAGATLWGGWVVWWTGQAPSVPSGRQWQGSQSSQRASELGFPRPALWQMQSEAAGQASEPSGQGEEAPPEGLVVTTPSSRPCARSSGPGYGPAPGRHSHAPLAGKRPEGRWLRPTPCLRYSDGILDLGVAAMVGLQFQGFPVPVGDEAVIAVAGEEGRLGTGRGLHIRRTLSEPHWGGFGLARKPESTDAERPWG